MNNKITLMIVMFLIVTPMIFAADPSFIFRQNSEAALRIPIKDVNGGACTTCTCDSTILLPNGTLLIDDVAATMANGFAVITLSDTQTTVIGEHVMDLTCTNGAINGSTTLTYLINPTGEETEGLTSLGIILAFVLIAALLFGASRFFDKEQVGIKTLLMMFGFGFLILTAQSAKIAIAGKVWLNEIAGVGLTVMIILFWVMTSYYFIIYTKIIFTKIANMRKRKQEERYGGGWM